LWRAAPESRIVYIGDGVSDFCPAEHADIIFAKKELAAYCNRQRLPHYPFTTLSDVARQIRLLLLRRRIRPRYQAQLRRKGVWEGE
jgi:2-hydroxy-3-keto-5-methylthiopentenyl-1-phosphate phosphatase